MKKKSLLMMLLAFLFVGTTAWADVSWDSRYPVTSVEDGKTYVIKAASKSYNYNGNTDFYFRSYNSTEFNCSYGIMMDGLNSYSWVAEEGSDGTFALKNVHTGTYATSSTSGSFVTGSSTAEYFTLAYDNALSVFTIKSSSNNYLTSGVFSASVTTTAPTTATDAACWTLYEVYDVKPVPANQIVDGQTYVIHNLNQKNRYLAKNDGAENMIASDKYSITDKAFLWTAEKQADGTFALLCHKKNEYLSNTFNSGSNTLEISNTAVGFTISPRADNKTVFTIKNGTQYVTLGDLSGWGFFQLYFSDAPQSDTDLGCWEFYEVISAEQSLAYDNAQAALDLGSGVGYPVEVERTALKNTMSTHVSSSYVADLNTAVTAYKTTTNVNLPENGRAYKISAVYPDGAKQTMYWNGTRMTANDDANTNSSNNVFVCAVKDGKFVFVNNSGKYWLWCDSGDNNRSYDKNGYSDTYVVQNELILSRAVVDGNSGGIIQSGTTNETFFGLLQIQGLDKNGTSTYYYVGRNDDGDDAFVTSGTSAKYYDFDSNWSSKYRTFAFTFEEVDYPNTPELNEATIDNDAMTLGTFSAPFATVIPEGVKAFYVAATTGETATLTRINAKAIPANTGVILTAETKTASALMVPATTETVATVSGNMLVATSNADFTPDENVYVLGAKGGVVAFYKGATSNTTLGKNKAYLQLSEGAAPALIMSFGNGEATGVEGVEAAPAAQEGAIFDLSGRRVLNPTKGLYIIGGKKVYIK